MRVRDNGIGIPEADLPTIFESFRRGGNVAGRMLGTGLGLANVRQIVEQHGGTIRVASGPGPIPPSPSACRFARACK
jgi:signal transduction histidine kinase